MTTSRFDTRSRAAVDAFLAHRRIAFVGLSRDPRDFSHVVAKGFGDRGDAVIPVNPAAGDDDTAFGSPFFASVAAIPEPPAAALVMVPAAEAAAAVESCAAAGIRSVWLHRGIGAGAVSAAAVEAGERAGLDMVVGQCPLMFLDGTGIHGFHARVKRLDGTLPVGAAALARPVLRLPWILAWGLVLFAAGWLNGAFRELALRPLLGAIAMPISAGTLLLVSGLVMAWLLRRKVPPANARHAAITGLVWAASVAVLEFVAFALFGTHTMAELLAMYDVTRDPSWVAILVWTAVFPLAWWSFRRRAKRSPPNRPGGRRPGTATVSRGARSVSR